MDNMGKSRPSVLFRIFSAAMGVLCIYGVYGFFTVPPKAAAEQKAIEEMLKENQRIAEERMAALAAKTPEPTPEPTPTPIPCVENENDPFKYWQTYTEAGEMKILYIGDSVTLAALNRLYERFPNGTIDAVYGRVIGSGPQVISAYKENGTEYDAVVLQLFTNVAVISEEDCQKLYDLISDKPSFWITAYGVGNNANQILNSFVPAHEYCYLIDWNEYAYGHFEWMLADNLHPNDTGSQELANLTAQRINEVLLSPSEEEKACLE